MPNAVYQEHGTIVAWRDSGADHAITMTSLATAAGRQGAQHDFGTAAAPRRFAWRAWITPGATRVVGERVEVYWKSSDGTIDDNDDGTGDIAVSAVDKLRNLWLLDTIQIDENAAVPMAKSGTFEVLHRYGQPVFWNRTQNTLSATASQFGFTIVPVYDEVQ